MIVVHSNNTSSDLNDSNSKRCSCKHTSGGAGGLPRRAGVAGALHGREVQPPHNGMVWYGLCQFSLVDCSLICLNCCIYTILYFSIVYCITLFYYIEFAPRSSLPDLVLCQNTLKQWFLLLWSGFMVCWFDLFVSESYVIRWFRGPRCLPACQPPPKAGRALRAGRGFRIEARSLSLSLYVYIYIYICYIYK